jgi:UDP-N-acetylmuramate: L-alanyl-gamma-D-glutamyl-meso-diaminopimelate ligase
LIALIEPRSNTMRMGEYREQLATSTADADAVHWFQPEGLDWSLDRVVERSPVVAHLHTDIQELVENVAGEARTGDQIVIMSNGSFGGVHQKLLTLLEGQFTNA